MTKAGAVLLTILMVGGWAVAQQEEAPVTTSPLRVVWDGDVCVYAQAGWELRIEYLNKGTRSEGQNGVLRRRGQIVQASKDGETIEKPFGILKWYGTERKKLWDVTGWNFADRKRIRRSEQVKPLPEAPIEPAPAP